MLVPNPSNSDPSPDEITRLLNDVKDGRTEDADRLAEYVFAELHRLALGFMRGERNDHTLQPTALVNEAYVRLAGSAPIDWKSRAHFFGIAARTMRRILVEHARRRKTAKRGEGAVLLELQDATMASKDPILLEASEVLDLDAALDKLKEMDPRLALVIEMRYFTGMTVSEVAEALGLSEKTISRDWRFAKTWLREEMEARRQK